MNRPYDLIIYGATGYLGTLITKYIWTKGPPNLRWAIAGRDSLKLQDFLSSLQKPDRTAPGFVVASLNREGLERMASQTRVILNTVGPFCKHGTPVVEACINHSTAYIDPTGEHIWTYHLATELHDRALKNKAIIIPHCAIESTPPDLLSHLLVRDLPRPAGSISFAIEHTWPGFSGGTVASILAGLETYSIQQMITASAVQAFCVPGAGAHNPLSRGILPVYRDKHLGDLTFNPSATTDRAVVMRSWSLLQRYGLAGEKYGERFGFRGYAVARGRLRAWATFLGLSIAVLGVVLLPPVRWLLRWLAPEPGTGPRVSSSDRHFVEWKAVIRDEDDREALMGVMRMNMDVYSASAVLVSEAALTVLSVLDGEADSLARRLGGGILTPASLGIGYLERLERAGLERRVFRIGKADG